MKEFHPKKKIMISDNSDDLIRIRSEILEVKDDFYKAEKLKKYSEGE